MHNDWENEAQFCRSKSGEGVERGAVEAMKTLVLRRRSQKRCLREEKGLVSLLEEEEEEEEEELRYNLGVLILRLTGDRYFWSFSFMFRIALFGSFTFIMFQIALLRREKWRMISL